MDFDICPRYKLDFWNNPHFLNIGVGRVGVHQCIQTYIDIRLRFQDYIQQIGHISHRFDKFFPAQFLLLRDYQWHISNKGFLWNQIYKRIQLCFESLYNQYFHRMYQYRDQYIGDSDKICGISNQNLVCIRVYNLVVGLCSLFDKDKYTWGLIDYRVHRIWHHILSW